jgi:hypothetical protein
MLLGFLLPSATFGEINATQGVTNVSNGPAEFHSPMVLDAPFPLTDREQWGSGNWSEPGIFPLTGREPGGTGNWSDPAILQQLRDYRCDGLTILQMQMRGELHSDGSLEVQVKGKIDAIKGHDKRVDMKFDFINGDVVGATGHSASLKAPEKKVRDFSFKFTIPAAVVQSQPPTHLRVTFSDYDD